ncbi:hypothetical protein [Vibrio europaeus]|uniref:hypothetical protein n=1 Tax=Vibrio europaeus TaxID=300876 RepID=UPI00148B742D|nr:hypothetical protein [Vibrio europaeus]
MLHHINSYRARKSVGEAITMEALVTELKKLYDDPENSYLGCTAANTMAQVLE